MTADPGSTTGTQADLDADITDLEKLAAELAERGLRADLYAPNGRLPFLQVRNPNVQVLTETVYAQADAYWYSWAEKVADCDDPAQAADTLARVLAATANTTGE
jgi:hypothetical protein